MIRMRLLVCLAVFFFGLVSRAPAQDKFRLGIVGLTHDHAWGILRDVAKRSDVEVVGIAEGVPELRQQAAKALGHQVTFYDDYQKMLDEAKPQAIMCFGDNRQHLAVVKAAATRKVHVMMEKPLAPTFEQARQTYEAARKGGIKLMVNYWIAWSPETETAHERVEAGDVGTVRKMQARFGHRGPIEIGVSKYFGAWLTDPELNGGGAIIDFGCYGADLLRWYLGKPSSVSAVTHTFKPQTYPKVDDDAVIVVNYPNAVGIIEASWNWPNGKNDLQVFGDKGELLADRNLVRVTQAGGRKDVELKPLPPERQNATAFFIDAVRNNKPIDGILSPEFNLDVAEILEAAKMSARTGKTVALPLK